TLLVAADCGTSSLHEIAYAHHLGIDVIVLDHHSLPPTPPPALALLNPKQLPPGDHRQGLATVGLAYLFMQALYHEMGRDFQPDAYLGLVALGTLADMAPLLGANRALVREGLRALRHSPCLGLAALIEAAGLGPGTMDAEAISFCLAPRLNAAGRLSGAHLSLDLLLTNDPAEAQSLAAQLNRLNRERQRMTREALNLAHGLLEKEDPDAPLLFLGHPEFHLGIVGLVAGRLCEERYRPTIVYWQGAHESRASGRAIPEFDIVQALRGQASLLLRYGGHRAAAGFTARNETLPTLKKALQAQAEEALTGLDLSPVLEVDAEVPLRELRGDVIRWLAAFAPAGQEAPEPTFLSCGVKLAEVRPLGGEGQNLRLKLRDGNIVWPGVAFGLRDRSVQEGMAVDLVYSFAQDRRNQGALELRVKDLRPTP
ncbi:MAG TPA: DHH family phosphoesterase, partial [Dehalococcoidia bacterium]|nr:DHH family phosphoesterase [Dehalococcoidia bacterium]